MSGFLEIVLSFTPPVLGMVVAHPWPRSPGGVRQMMEPLDDLLLRRRRRFLALKSLTASGLSAVGLVMSVSGGIWFGYFITAFFGLVAVAWAWLLLTPPDVLLTMNEGHFHWFGPEYASASTPRPESRPATKPVHHSCEPNTLGGVWDRELDGGP
jgi:hypothetical protein